MDRAIAQSGTSLCSWAILNYVGEYTKRLGKHMNCPVSNSTELVDCLRNKDARDLILFQHQIEVCIFVFSIQA